MSPSFSVLSVVSMIIGVVFMVALSVAAVLAVARLRHPGSWLLLAGALLQWAGFGFYALRSFIGFIPTPEASFAIQMGVAGLGRLLMVAGLILIVLYARALQGRASEMERLAEAARGGALPGS